MKSGTKIGLLGTAATLVVGGIALLLSVESPASKVAAVICIGLAFIIPVAFWVADALGAEKRAVHIAADAAAARIVTCTNVLEETAHRLGIQNNARFLPEGFLGLQKQSLVLEEDPQTGREWVRMAVLGHLPSHIRLEDLSEERGRQLYDNWEPPHLVSDYVRLINRRSSALRRFLDNGGIVREIYDKTKLEQYVAQGSTFHDKVEDPKEEILERLRALLHFIDKGNYYIWLAGGEEDAPGPHFLLKQGVGLVMDIRTAETQKHFTKSLDGLFASSQEIMEGFEEKFRMSWRQMEKEKAREFLQGLVSQVKA